MNTVWSTYIQNIGTLYTSRCLRFADRFRDSYLQAFGIPDGKRILEIGCGPGALALSLRRWYPNAQICGIDRDSNFISFARENVPGVSFLEGDATVLAFEDASFDVTVSNTVAEHIEPTGFFGEQHRVLRDNGICLVLSSRRGIHIPAACIAQETEYEKLLWKRVDIRFQEARTKYQICRYPMNETQLPAAMERCGFQNVSSHYITVNLTPDDPSCPPRMAHAIINANRQNDLDNIQTMAHLAADLVSSEELSDLTDLVNARYDRRIQLYDRGIRQWDTDVAIIQVVRGIR